ncbi:MAG: hypothetical protein PF450_01740 [Bacteroidales bacterium]|jgi:hypothetical protein|nr:hypothetical protein [Bacteroidales bacterium]
MISQNNTKKVLLIDYTADVLIDTAEKLLHEQSGILETYFNRRSGTLARHLKSRPFHVKRNSTGVSLTIDYMAQIRFMDLKKAASGKKKKIYHPIYNKPVYGYLFGYAYDRMRTGLTEYLRQETTAKVETLTIEIPT